VRLIDYAIASGLLEARRLNSRTLIPAEVAREFCRGRSRDPKNVGTPPGVRVVRDQNQIIVAGQFRLRDLESIQSLAVHNPDAFGKLFVKILCKMAEWDRAAYEY